MGAAIGGGIGDGILIGHTVDSIASTRITK